MVRTMFGIGRIRKCVVSVLEVEVEVKLNLLIVGPGPPPLLLSKAHVLASPSDEIFRDPAQFVPGELHNHIE